MFQKLQCLQLQNKCFKKKLKKKEETIKKPANMHGSIIECGAYQHYL